MAQSDYGGFFNGCPVLITGGAGFIGSHLGARLIELGARVGVLDDLSGGFERNIPAGAEFFRGSVLDRAALGEAIHDRRVVYHQAAMVSVPESVAKPEECVRVNVEGTQRVLEAARVVGARVVFAASAAAYGNAAVLPCREDQPADCFSPYAMSKVAGEQLLAVYARCYGLSTVSLRYMNIFGPRQNPNSPYAAVISALHKALASGGQPTIFGDGRQTRDFTYVANVVHANLLAGSRPLAGEVINIGTGRQTSLLEVLETLAKVMGVEARPTFGPVRAGDVRDSVADITRAREVLGYEPLIGLEDGLRRMIAT
jgi:UDP-glucose 4-epimerase